MTEEKPKAKDVVEIIWNQVASDLSPMNIVGCCALKEPARDYAYLRAEAEEIPTAKVFTILPNGDQETSEASEPPSEGSLDSEFCDWEQSFQKQLAEDCSDSEYGSDRALDGPADLATSDDSGVHQDLGDLEGWREWYQCNAQKGPEYLAEKLNQEDESGVKRILYLEATLTDQLTASRDPWKNPTFLSWVKYRVLPFNISSRKAKALKKRARNYRWLESAEDNLVFLPLDRRTKQSAIKYYPSLERRKELLKNLHSEAHQQPHGMLARLAHSHFWYQMRGDVTDYVRQCTVCQTDVTMVTADRVMNPIAPGPKGRRWHIDLIGPLAEGGLGREIRGGGHRLLQQVARGGSHLHQEATRSGTSHLSGGHCQMPGGRASHGQRHRV